MNSLLPVHLRVHTRWFHMEICVMEWYSTPLKERQHGKGNATHNFFFFLLFYILLLVPQPKVSESAETSVNSILQEVSKFLSFWKNLTIISQTWSHPNTDSCHFLHLLRTYKPGFYSVLASNNWEKSVSCPSWTLSSVILPVYAASATL